jgi:hypothetical protein
MSYNTNEINRRLNNISRTLDSMREDCRQFRATCQDFRAPEDEYGIRAARPLGPNESVEDRETSIHRYKLFGRF